MKKSSQVPASMIIALAASLSANGCAPRDQCTDARGNLLPDSYCGGGYGYTGAHWVHVQSGGFGGGGGSFGGGGSSGG